MLFGPLRETDFTADRRANFSSYIRENQNQTFSDLDMDFVLRLRSPSVPEKASKLLRFMSNEHPYAGEHFSISHWAAAGQLRQIAEHTQPTYEDDAAMFDECELVLPYIAASWSRNAEEFEFLLLYYLKDAQRFIEEEPKPQMLRITAEGWKYLEHLERPSSESTTAFVAMWFSDETDELWKKAVRPAIYDAGYEAIRIDAVEHSNKIDDEIIAHIRSCRFVVADFTGQRGGVYFEAGFALGLDKRVIWCVREDGIKEVHFDNRQYNFLRWKKDELEAFKQALTNRVQALFGKGPLKLK